MTPGGNQMTRLEELGQRIDAREARIGVIGLGYVGLPLALGFAKAGFAVSGFELDAEKVKTLSEGRSYIEDVAAGVLTVGVFLWWVPVLGLTLLIGYKAVSRRRDGSTAAAD